MIHRFTSKFFPVAAILSLILLSNSGQDLKAGVRAESSGTGLINAGVPLSKVNVRFHAGIYRKWDKSWMTTAPQDVVATLTSSAGTLTKHPEDDTGLVIFEGVPCGEEVRINLKFVGSADYESNSRSYTRRLGCKSRVANLGRLEYGVWR
jgi:hypothetical protein